MAGLFTASPRAYRFRSGRCGLSVAIPARKCVLELGQWRVGEEEKKLQLFVVFKI
jgi:hypothetical protein